MKYIQQALDSVLMQKVNFSWNVVIADDYSTDGTREILLEYKEKYSDLLHLILQENNVGASQNCIDLLSYPNCKYIAYLDGDDYWTDPYKLQKQIDFLENNPEYGICYSKARFYIQNSKKFLKRNYGRQLKAENLDDLITNNGQIPSLTVCVRKELLPRYYHEIKPDTRWFLLGDRPFWIWIAYNSKIHYFDEIFGVYRVVNKSASHPNSYDKKKEYHTEYYSIKIFFADLYDRSYLKNIIEDKMYLTLANLSIKFKKYTEFREYISKVKRSTKRVKMKKVIAKSLLFMMIYHYLSYYKSKLNSLMK